MTVDGKRNHGRPKLRPGERRYGQKPDDDRDGRGPRTLAWYDPSRYTTQCRGGYNRGEGEKNPSSVVYMYVNMYA